MTMDATAMELGIYTFAERTPDPRTGHLVSAEQRLRDLVEEIELAEQTKDLGSIADLEAKVAADPKDYQARFDLALAQNAKGNREAALDNLIEIVKRDRKWNDDGARKQLVQLFDAWGPTDEATVTGRRKLSSVLFA